MEPPFLFKVASWWLAFGLFFGTIDALKLLFMGRDVRMFLEAAAEGAGEKPPSRLGLAFWALVGRVWTVWVPLVLVVALLFHYSPPGAGGQEVTEDDPCHSIYAEIYEGGAGEYWILDGAGDPIGGNTWYLSKKGGLHAPKAFEGELDCSQSLTVEKK